ncbi:MAG: hypothetical protein NT096_02960 [Proteobacteria bacterium]|nr:hypothetical protein [Pseudomonadota bacterium]
MRRTWSYAAMTKDEGNDADGRFSAACYCSNFCSKDRQEWIRNITPIVFLENRRRIGSVRLGDCPKIYGLSVAKS